MDSLILSTRNRSFSNTNQGSKLYAQEGYLGSNDLKFQDQLSHNNCSCYHCLNNTKPIQQPAFTRIKAVDEFSLTDNQAFVFIVQKMSEYYGSLKIPDMFIAHNSSIAYVGSHKAQIKIKPNVALNQIKKYFDSRRAQYNKILKNQNNDTVTKKKLKMSKLNNSKLQSKLMKKNSFISDSQKKKQMKQIAFLNYNSISSQLVTQISLNKYLNKRKNDSFWQQISSISLIPPYREDQLTLHSYFYQRTQGNVQEMQQLMEQVAKKIDEEERWSQLSHLVGNSIPQSTQNSSDKFTQLLTIAKGKTVTLNSPTNQLRRKPSFEKFDFDEDEEKEMIESMSKQIVAYLQVKLHIRISSCVFKYVIDYDGNFYFTSVEKFIAANLKPKQLKIVHDRYKMLEIDDSQEMAKLKMQIEQNKHAVLQNSLAELVVECLQKRKNQLMERQAHRKQPYSSQTIRCEYFRLSNENLVRIFKKIFPTFNQEEIFTNPNWQNEFKVYIGNCRKEISKVIRQDEGIRILKRFGIIFYRTWGSD